MPSDDAGDELATADRPSDSARPAADDGIEPAVRRAVRLELRRLARNVSQVAAGVCFALFVLPMLLAVFVPPLFEAGVPPAVLLVCGLVGCAGLVAYGWRLPPFR